MELDFIKHAKTYGCPIHVSSNDVDVRGVIGTGTQHVCLCVCVRFVQTGAWLLIAINVIVSFFVSSSF